MLAELEENSVTGLGSDLDNDIKSDGTPTISNNQPIQPGGK